MIQAHLDQGWRFSLADIHGKGAARMEAAPARRVIERWRLARDAQSLRFIVDLG